MILDLNGNDLILLVGENMSLTLRHDLQEYSNLVGNFEVPIVLITTIYICEGIWK